MPTPEFSLVSLVLPPRTRLTSEWRHSETLESLALLALFGLKKAGLSPIWDSVRRPRTCLIDTGKPESQIGLSLVEQG